jgi:WD40 repeat protein
VRYNNTQSLTDVQKARAKTNIGSVGYDSIQDIPIANRNTARTNIGAVGYESQTLTDAQKQQARTNIGAGTSSFSGSYNDLTNSPIQEVYLPKLGATYTWDGVIDGKQVAVIGALEFYKISDYAPTKEEMVGAYCTVYHSNNHQTDELNVNYSPDGTYNQKIYINENGLWFKRNMSGSYVKSLTLNGKATELNFPLSNESLPTTVPVIQSASVGQTIIVKSVDQNDKPTEWEVKNFDYVSYNEQTLTNEQKEQTRTNIGAGTSSFSGNYNDLTNKPFIGITSRKKLNCKAGSNLYGGEIVSVSEGKGVIDYQYLTNSTYAYSHAVAVSSQGIIASSAMEMNSSTGAINGYYVYLNEQNGSSINLKSSLGDFGDHIRSLTFSPDGSLLVVEGHFDGKLKLYSISGTTAAYISDIYADANGTAFSHSDYVITFSPDGTMLAIVSSNANDVIRIYSVSGSNIIYQYSVGNSNYYYWVRFNPAGNLLFTNINIYSVSDGQINSPSVGRFPDNTRKAIFSPDCKYIIATYLNGVKVYSVDGFNVSYIKELSMDNNGTRFNANIEDIAFNSDGTQLVVAGRFTGRLKLYSVSGQNITYIIPDEAENVFVAYVKTADIEAIEVASKTGDESNSPLEDKLFEPNCITVSNNGSVGYAFYQQRKFTCTHDVNPLYLRHRPLTVHIAMFLCTLIEKEQFRWDYGRKWRPKRMPSSLIKLPVTTDGSPDWEYMENYIKGLPYSRL